MYDMSLKISFQTKKLRNNIFEEASNMGPRSVQKPVMGVFVSDMGMTS